MVNPIYNLKGFAILKSAKLFFTLPIIFSLALCTSNSSGTAYVKLNVNDCAKCSASFETVNRLKYVDSIVLVVRGELKNEKKELIGNLGLMRFKKFRYQFNDSLYNYFQKNSRSISSSLFIIRNGKLVFSSPLNKSNSEEITYQLLLDNIKKICPKPQVKNVQKFILPIRHYVVSQDNYNNILVSNLVNDKQHLFSFNEPENLVMIYKRLYMDSFKYKYQFMKDAIERNPKLKPFTYQSYLISDDNKLFVSYNAWNYEIESDFTDTTYYSSAILCLYNLGTNKLEKVFLPDTNSTFGSMRLDRIFISEGHITGIFDNYNGKFKSIVYPISLNYIDDIFTCNDKPLTNPFPSNYYERIPTSWRLALKSSNHSVLYHVADSIYSSYHKKMIDIPFPNIKDLSNIRNYNNFYNQRDNLFSILYFKKGENDILYYLAFDDKGKRKYFKAFKNEKNGPAEFINSYEWVQFNNKKKCFELVSVLDK